MAVKEEAGEEIRVKVRVCSSVNPKNEEEEEEEERNPNPNRSGSSSSSSPPFSGSCMSWQCGNGSDRMVKIEIDAANALAEFARLALLASKISGGFSVGKWGNKGRRSRNRCRNGSQERFCRWYLPDSSLNSRRFQDQFLNKGQYRHQNSIKNTVKKTVKVPRDIELPKSISKHSKSNISSHRGNSKQNLSEVDKEERRLHRVQANRESARQTIKRRQALCEELTKKAADLAWDNECIKQEKELAMQECLALKDKNKHLKEQVAKKKIKDGAKKSPPENILSHTETPASPPMQVPFLLYNGTHFMPFAWPSIMQPFNHLQTQQTPQNNIDPSRGQGCLGGKTGQRSPFYLLPCPWFLPLTDQASGSRAVFSGDAEHVSELSKKAMENAESTSFLDGAKSKTSDSTKAANSNGNSNKIVTESSAILSEDKGGQILVPCSLEATQMPVLGNINLNLSSNRDNELRLDPASKEAVSSFGYCPVGNSQEGASIHHSRKMVDTAAATEARKRRKELTKLKNLHGRKLR